MRIKFFLYALCALVGVVCAEEVETNRSISIGGVVDIPTSTDDIVDGVQDTVDQIQSIDPLEDGECFTDDMKQNFEDGGWSAIYMRRLWDSKAAVMTIGLFFPPPIDVAAAAAWMDELRGQSESFQREISNLTQEEMIRLRETLQRFMQSGSLNPFLISRNLGVKAALVHVRCTTYGNLPAEGYTQVAFGWRHENFRNLRGE